MQQESVHPGENGLAHLAARQHGVVSNAQLLAAGVSPNGISRRLKSGRLHRLHRGVYAVGHVAVSAEGRWLAAVLACGDGAALSHRSAAALWDLRQALGALIDVAVPRTGGRRQRQGIRVHRSATLTDEQLTVHRGIPVTTPARTIADLARCLPSRELRAVIRRAEILRLDAGEQAWFGADDARSGLERRFLALCRRHCLPLPQVNVPVDAFVADFLWPHARVIVETDSWGFHSGRVSFEDDRARDVRLKLLGYEVLRVTDRQLRADPDTLLCAIRRLLEARAA